MEWTEGRKLASVTYNNKETAFEYNHEGLRIKKTLHDGSYILYDIVDGVYVGETRYTASGSVSLYMRYILDEGNSPVGISLWYPATGGWTDYHFVKNLQGDVLEVYKVSDGSLAASYTYDSWGNILSQSGDLATLNPFRYRSYYYDTETWFYYLQSRYYDPAIGRFLNADSYVSTGQDVLSFNMFAYCGNNPVMGYDPTGEFDWKTFVNGASLLSVGVTACLVAATVVSGGACAPLLAVAVVTFAAGGVTAVNGASEIIESATGYNVVRDGLYGGDVQGYEMQRDILATTAAVGTTALSLASGSTALCFVAGTVVLAAEGSRTIETIMAGDMVWAWDEETGEVALKEVVETYVNETDELVHVFVNGDEIITTPSHPFYSPVKGWTDAVHLRAGDILVLLNGEYVVVEKVQHEILETPVTVYNFQVEDYHTYYVSSGILVHNTCRGNAVKKAWKNEQELVRTTGQGTRNWTPAQMKELLNTGKVKGFVGHHMKSVKGFPNLAGEPNNIQFLTRAEHLLAHGGNWRNITYGRYII